MKLEDIGEFGLIDRIRKIVDKPAKDLVLGIGDDAAVFDTTAGHATVVTTDVLTEGVHFDLSYFSYYDLGWRALAANLSDIAAMAAVPRFALFSIGLTERVAVEAVEQLFSGARALADRFAVSIIGGDTTASPDRTFLSVTVIGEVAKAAMTTRSGAQPGDTIFVTGDVGGAMAGFKALRAKQAHPPARISHIIDRHLRPLPRIAEAQYLTRNLAISAMIDISDGVASEVGHICRNSQTGAEVWTSQLPIHDETMHIASENNENARDYALHGGEDFELLFAARREQATILAQFRQKFGVTCTAIGKITEAEKGIRFLDQDGRELALSQTGYSHFG